MKASWFAPALLTVTAFLMPISSVLVSPSSFETGPGQAVTPPGIFFSIWGVVILGCLAISVLSWWRHETPIFRAAAWPLVVAQAGFSVWLLCAALETVSTALAGVATVAVFAVILASLVVAMSRLRGMTGSARWLVAGTVGIYAGWSSAAIWLNVVTCLPASLANSVVVQSLGIVGAAVTIVAIIVLLRPYVTYLIAVVWALAGIAISAAQFRVWLTFVLAALGIVVFLAAWIGVQRRSEPVPRVV